MKKRFGSRVLLIRRKYIVALALTLAVVAIFYIINQAGLAGATARARSQPIYTVAPIPELWYNVEQILAAYV